MSSSLTIGIVAPARALKRELAAKLVRFVSEQYGGEVSLRIHPQCFLSEGHFAGRDVERGRAFLDFANSPEIDLIWFARGGYGSMRFDDEVFTRLNAHARAKAYIGYSDMGAILTKLYQLQIGRPVHGPMPGDLAHEGGERAIARVLDYVTGNSSEGIERESQSPHPRIAMNLTVLHHLIGTNWQADLSGHVLMLEDIGEYEYAIDRKMFTLCQNDNIRQVAGIAAGRFSNVPVNDDVVFGMTPEEIIRFWCDKSGIPYLGKADIGHDLGNKIVVWGKS